MATCSQQAADSSRRDRLSHKGVRAVVGCAACRSYVIQQHARMHTDIGLYSTLPPVQAGGLSAGCGLTHLQEGDCLRGAGAAAGTTMQQT